jgi:hypothetical protein
LCQLRTDRLDLVNKIDYVLAHLMFPELDDTPLYLTDVHWDIWGPPMDARRGIAWKICTRVRWTRLDSLIVMVNCGHLWCLRGSRVS